MLFLRAPFAGLGQIPVEGLRLGPLGLQLGGQVRDVLGQPFVLLPEGLLALNRLRLFLAQSVPLDRELFQSLLEHRALGHEFAQPLGESLRGSQHFPDRLGQRLEGGDLLLSLCGDFLSL